MVLSLRKKEHVEIHVTKLKKEKNSSAGDMEFWAEKKKKRITDRANLRRGGNGL